MNLKELLKNKKLAGGVAAAVLVAAAAVTTALLWPHNTPPLETAPVSDTPGASVSLPEVSAPETTGSLPEQEGGTPDASEAVDVTVSLEQQPTAPTGTPVEKTEEDDSGKADDPAQPVTPVEPEEPSDESGIQIGGGDTTTPAYSCGSPNHHCKNAEAHAYLLNLELEGCQYCGSHSCPSFYGVDEWGNTGLTPELCPKYDEKKDPVKYCQDCGEKTGDGSNGTCAQFVEDCDCPLCGEHVKAWTCHTCK